MRIIILIALALFAASASAQNTLELTAPNGGEMYLTGSDTLITWAGIPLTDTVKLEYSIDDGSSWNLITDTATGGSYAWHVPGTVSDRCLVRVTEVNYSFSNSWAKRGGGDGNDNGRAIAIDRQGNVYVTGIFSSTPDFDGIKLTASGDYNVFLVKYRVDGKLLWVRAAASGVGPNYSQGIAIDSVGNSYITGQFESIADFDGVTLTSAGRTDIFLAKYNPDGVIQWAKQVGGIKSESAGGIAIDRSGDIYISGGFDTLTDIGGNHLISKGDRDGLLVKYHPDGSVVWVRKAGRAICTGVTTSNSDNIYVVGEFDSLADFNAIPINAIPGRNIFIAEINSSGDVLWVKQVADSANCHRMAVDMLDNILLTGSFGNHAYFPGSNTINSTTKNNFFVAKFQANGNLIWVEKTGEGYDYNSSSESIASDRFNNIFITGEFAKFCNFGGLTLTTRTNSPDIFVAKYLKDGTLDWVKSAGGDGSDVGAAIAIDDSNNIAITGFFQNTGMFSGDSLRSWDNDIDVLVWKLGADFIQSDTSNSLFTISRPKTLIAIKDNYAYAGDHKNIPIILESSPINPTVFSVASNFSARVAYDNRLLTPEMGAIQKGINNFDTVTVQGSLTTSDTIGYVPFHVLLGESTTSPMNIVEFHWLDAKGNPVAYDAETENGTFHLLYGCGDSTIQQFMLTGKTPSITSVNPNPTNGMIHIDIQTTETGRTQLQVMNLLGASVATISDGELKPGANSFDFNTAGLPSGSYFLLMQTPTARRLERIDVKK